jgi:ABC-2 type transport system ATP-binding protein
MIIASELVKDYGELRAVDEVSFEIRQGECIGLLGLNGAGKTTLLRIMSCLLTPTSGSVKVDGADVTRESETVRKKIGFLPEEPPLYGEMTVGKFLEFAARLRGVPRTDVGGRVQDAARRCRVDEVIDQRIETLSYGYKKRVGIAQAVVHRPPLLILDEPIAGLDPAQIVDMRDLVHGLRGEHTVVLSSHILNEISQTCDRILVMQKGRVVASGSEEELSAGMGAGKRVNVRVRGKKDQVEDALKGVEGVKSWELSETDGTVRALITSEKDRRAEISRVLVQAGLDLIEIGRPEGELESVFLKLTGEGRGGS